MSIKHQQYSSKRISEAVEERIRAFRQFSNLSEGSTVLNSIGGPDTVAKLPLLDILKIRAHAQGELGESGEQAKTIMQIVSLLQGGYKPAPSKVDFEGEIKSSGELFSARSRQFAEITHLFDLKRIIASETEAFLESRIEIAGEIMHLSCFWPFYSQFSHGAMDTIHLMNSALDIVDMPPFPSEGISNSQMRVLMMQATADMMFHGIHANLYKSHGAAERARIAALSMQFFIAQEACNGQGTAKKEKNFIINEFSFGPSEISKAASKSIETCLSNGDYVGGARIAKAYNFEEQPGIMQKLQELVHGKPEES